MSKVRKCYNANCENNYEGAYCECCEIALDESGCCCCYTPKQKETKGEEYEDISCLRRKSSGM